MVFFCCVGFCVVLFEFFVFLLCGVGCVEWVCCGDFFDCVVVEFD